eukprot:TRINITY_DN305_c0_g1_i2.p1 TRINITY_DN305_c0_g1~~TRINITY_DN305_c0_g1_i2.p1  ORF type:complete len:448 (+),score=124.96 TRINITY_DN305_c0_g1_i2:33-1346(+)
MEATIEKNVKYCREHNVILPTLEEMVHPEKIPQKIKDELKDIGLWDVNSRNLFRITWKNENVEKGGKYMDVPNHFTLPSSLTGVKSKITLLLGRTFPTGAHKVGATYIPLVEGLVSGEFDPQVHKALWPSTGNYCRGGAFDSALLASPCIAVLPEEMSAERFQWLKNIGAEIHATPGCESNVKEVFDKTRELSTNNPDTVRAFNQFEIFGNPLWHYNVTGPAVEEVFNAIKSEDDELFGVFSCTGSAGTIAFADYIRDVCPSVKVGAGEALQCPTMLNNGYGGHRIEGIGDKHIPWIHNVRNTDIAVALDDEHTMRLFRLFNTKIGHDYLIEKGVEKEVVDRLGMLGISGIANMIGCIKMARLYETSETDHFFTIATDSSDMYQSRLTELTAAHGEYTLLNAAMDYDRCLQGQSTDNMLELTYTEKKRVHNLKYFTW